MKRYTILGVVLLFTISCKEDLHPFYYWFGETSCIHIICDARKTGTVEPWLLEFDRRIGSVIDVRKPAAFMQYPSALFELGDTTKHYKVEYLGGMPLIEKDSLIQTFLPEGLTDTAYKHYCFALNDKLLDKVLFKYIVDPEYDYGTMTTRQKYVTVILSTNDSNLAGVIERCNRYLTDSLSKKGYYVTTH